jgi:hypothetical protein
MRIPALVALFLVALSASGADIKKGLEAAKRGDFATALQEWKPLADQDNGPA